MKSCRCNFSVFRKKPFCGLYKQFVELTDSLTQQVIELHTQLISTSILHDADGGDWANMKDFYEVSVNHTKISKSSL